MVILTFKNIGVLNEKNGLLKFASILFFGQLVG